MDRHVEDLEHLRHELGKEKLVLIGHSMGGYLAAAYARRYPDHIAALVLAASIPLRATETEMTEGLMEPTLARWQRPDVVEEFTRNGISPAMQSYLNPVTEAPPVAVSPRQRSLWHRIGQGAINLHDVRRWREVRGTHFYAARPAAAAAESMPETWDLTDTLAQLNIPVLVLHGDDDFLPVAGHRSWTADVPNARLEVLPDAGHLLWIDQPILFAELLGTFLELNAQE